MDMPYMGNESDEKLAQRFLDLEPDTGFWEVDEVVELTRAAFQAESFDDPNLVTAVRTARESGCSWEEIGRGIFKSAEVAQAFYGDKVA